MAINTGIIQKSITVLVLIVVAFLAYSVIVPEAQSGGSQLNASNRCEDASCFYNASRAIDCTANNVTGGDTTVCTDAAAANGIPLAGLFGASGVVFVIIMASFLILIVRGVMKKK